MSVVGMRKVIIAILSMIFIVSILGGCSRADGFQDVQNITNIAFSCDFMNSEESTRFDLDNGVVYFDDSKESVLDPSEIESIRNAIAVAEKWDNHYHYEPFSFGRNRPFTYKIIIDYYDGTSCEFEGYTLADSLDSAKWPKGFDELRSTLEGIVNLRRYGSFAVDTGRYYSYDGNYYASVSNWRHDIDIVICSDDGEKSYPVCICDSSDFRGLCWENDNYNLWIQTKNGDTLCYSKNGEEWTLNENAVKPDYIIGKGVV